MSEITCVTLQRWRELSISAGIHQDPEQMFREMERRYTERHRAYHNVLHIDECLQEFDRVRYEARNPLALELAIWFHDVIYDPKANDNEEQSARFASECLKGVSSNLTRDIADLIMATKSHVAGQIQDAPLLIDIDLSILGKPPERFARFEAGIRNEYAWVPIEIYRKKRAEILEGFLRRQQIYTTEFFQNHYESTARHNVSKLIADLNREV